MKTNRIVTIIPGQNVLACFTITPNGQPGSTAVNLPRKQRVETIKLYDEWIHPS